MKNLFLFFIYDLLDNEGNILTFETFRNKYEIKTNFLHYASLVNAIKSLLSSTVTINETPTHIQIPVLPFKMKNILSTNKGSREIDNVLNSKKLIPKSQKKYADKGLNIDTYIWGKYNILPFKCLKDTTILWFQYRPIHPILATNTFLHMIHYTDSNKCTFCTNEPETLQHFFYDCNVVRKLWESVEKWIYEKTGVITTLTKYEIMFGILEGEQKYVLNWLIFNIKYYIYYMKILKKGHQTYFEEQISS